MGSISSNLPVTEKNIKDYETETFKAGISEMQGWRSNMEDASLIHLAKIQLQNFKTGDLGNDDIKRNESSSDDSDGDISKNISRKVARSIYNLDERTMKTILKENSIEYNLSIIGVFDGHGGSFVSRFVAENFITVFNNSWTKLCLKQLKTSKIDENENTNKFIRVNQFTNINSNNSNSDIYDVVKITSDKLKQAIIETFLDLDQLLRTKECEFIVNEYKHFKRDNLYLNNINDLLAKDDIELSSEENFAYHMGTTANVVFIYENYLIVANTGDSKTVLYSDGKAIELNTEHKTSTPGESERILKSGYSIHNNRVDGKLNLTRAIGDLQFKNRKLRTTEQAVTPYPEITTYELNENSEFLICACDGIWDCVEPLKLCEYIKKEIEKGINLSKIAAQIEDMILSKTNNSPIGTDNMTCVILQFK